MGGGGPPNSGVGVRLRGDDSGAPGPPGPTPSGISGVWTLASFVARKVTANVYATLDGIGGFPKYPGSDYDPGGPDAFFTNFWINQYDRVDTVVMGRRSFQGHLRVHSEANRKPTDPQFMFDYSRFLDKADKVALSRTMKKTNWQNSRIMKGDLARVLAKLRKEPGKGIIVEGGPAVVREVLARGLADDYWFLLQPVVWGKGPHYWKSMPVQQNLKLLSVERMKMGELVLHYEAVH
jgi:dihydrofolate reductase